MTVQKICAQSERLRSLVRLKRESFAAGPACLSFSALSNRVRPFFAKAGGLTRSAALSKASSMLLRLPLFALAIFPLASRACDLCGLHPAIGIDAEGESFHERVLHRHRRAVHLFRLASIRRL